MECIFRIKNLTSFFVLFFVISCSTSSTREIINPAGYKKDFTIGKIVIKESTGNTSDLYIDIQNRMLSSINDQLSKRKTHNKYLPKYTLHINIRDYEEGSAWLRWVVPGMGETYLNVEAILYDETNIPVSQHRASRSVQGGGGYTAGAWKRSFDSVAIELLDSIYEL